MHQPCTRGAWPGFRPRSRPPWFCGRTVDRDFGVLLASGDDALLDRAVTAYRSRFSTVGIFENQVFPGIPEALRTFREFSHSFQVVTAKPTVSARSVVRHFALDGYFEAIHGPALTDRTYSKADLVGAALKVAGPTRHAPSWSETARRTSARPEHTVFAGSPPGGGTGPARNPGSRAGLPGRNRRRFGVLGTVGGLTRSRGGVFCKLEHVASPTPRTHHRSWRRWASRPEEIPRTSCWMSRPSCRGFARSALRISTAAGSGGNWRCLWTTGMSKCSQGAAALPWKRDVTGGMSAAGGPSPSIRWCRSRIVVTQYAASLAGIFPLQSSVYSGCFSAHAEWDVTVSVDLVNKLKTRGRRRYTAAASAYWNLELSRLFVRLQNFFSCA